ncbi:hypothetical protein FPV67DRAFT_157416 [Lyophyllum atratum]|nr:hypothetical protein FPV67DRAFT_157416 [Lyophyllum atratum]
MPIHLPDAHKYRPEEKEKVIAVFKNHDRQKRYDFLDITTGVNQGIDITYWKDAYSIKTVNGHEDTFCPGLLYPRSLTVDEVWSRIAERLGAYVFATPPNWRPDPEEEDDSDQYGHPARPRKNELEDWRYRREYDRIRDADGDLERVREQERCAMCADRRTYWAVSPPVFLSRHSRRWHVHVDCLQHFMPRHQFGLKPVEVVEYV